MTKHTPIINILTYSLPFKLSNQIYNEYQTRFNDIMSLINKKEYYKNLKENIKTIELLLSLSIFHKRVISNLDAAVKFYKTVNMKSGAESIAIGDYKLTLDEKNQVLALVLTYQNLIRKYEIPQSLIESSDNKDFIRYFKNFKTESNKSENKPNNENQSSLNDELPF